MKRYSFLLLVLLYHTLLSAQEASKNVGLSKDLKVWVSVAVLFAILLALFFYMFILEKRIKKMEENSVDKK